MTLTATRGRVALPMGALLSIGLLLASIGPVAAAPADSNRLLASGIATEDVGSNDWTIEFKIHETGNGQSSKVEITQGVNGPVSTMDGSVCAGSYTLAGRTHVYVVGEVISGNQVYPGSQYQVFVIRKGGPLGADMSWVVAVILPTLASAQAYCATTVTTVVPAFTLIAPTDVKFKV